MSSIEPGSGWSERLNPRNWTLSWKLAVVGLVPALLALALGVLRIHDDAQQAGELSRSSRLVEVRDQVAGAANALRQERDGSTLFVAAGRTGDRGALEAEHGQADGEITEMVNALRGTGELDPATASALQRAEDGLGRLVRLRASVLGDPPVPYDQVVTRYSDIVGPLDALDRALLRQLRTPATGGLADAVTAVTGVTEQLAVEHTVIGAAIQAGKPQPGDAAVVNSANAQLAADYRDYQAALTPEQLSAFGLLPDASANARRDQIRTGILAAPFELGPLQADWDAAYVQSRSAADKTAGLLRGELVATSAAAEDRASNLAGLSAVILLLGLLIGITIAVVVARTLIRSLRMLRTSALDVAERRLPQTVESVRAGETPDTTVMPVPLTGRDEVVQVARAFDAVHVQAIKLAADQATLQAGVSAMFVNLSRRSQALVERQLQLIEQLENNEQDADQLSNLFQLDHLATRMRRNSENLLVLAGTDVAKRNVAAVPMVDVLRAAVSEVEQYQRIVVQAPPTVSILGRASSDLVHLLAELLDNATIFSPPDSQVVMSSTRTSDGAIVVEIADRGVGMTEDELGKANTRLGGPSSVDVSTSRRMGLFVVGRLAARHGVEVRLSSSAGGSGSGLTASVTVPTKLVPTSEPRRSGALVGAGMKKPPALGSSSGQQRPGRNGVGRPGSLSALVVGSDGPPDEPKDRPLPLRQPDQPAAPTANGSGSGLPTRQPGSSLRPPAVPFRPDHPDQPPADTGATAHPSAGRPDAERPADPHPVSDRPAPGPADRPALPAPPVRNDAPSEATADGDTPPSGAPESRPLPAPGERFDPAHGSMPPRGRPGLPDAPRTDPTPKVAQPDRGGAGLPQRRPSPRPNGPRPFPRVGPRPGNRQPAQAADGLFAPRLSTTPEPASKPYFDPTETTPIFEEIASAWFRSNRPVPVEYGNDPQPESRATPSAAGAPDREPLSVPIPPRSAQPGRPLVDEPPGRRSGSGCPPRRRRTTVSPAWPTRAGGPPAG